MHCIFIDLVFFCHAFYTWDSCSDDWGKPNPRIDVNELIDWLNKLIGRGWNYSTSREVIFRTLKTDRLIKGDHLIRCRLIQVRMYWSLRPSECMPWILLFCIFGDFYASGMQDAEVNKVTAYFFGMDKRLSEYFVLKCNQWKYWKSFIACGCRFSRSYTVYTSWFSKGWLLGIWAYQTMQWFPWVTTKQ